LFLNAESIKRMNSRSSALLCALTGLHLARLHGCWCFGCWSMLAAFGQKVAANDEDASGNL
jgi:hypothetical protein